MKTNIQKLREEYSDNREPDWTNRRIKLEGSQETCEALLKDIKKMDGLIYKHELIELLEGEK